MKPRRSSAHGRHVTEICADHAIALRMQSLLLAGNPGTTPLEIVDWFGAMQAQDISSGKWSIGVRLDKGTETEVDQAIESGEILRTWPMRGTIHFIAGRDARWMLATTGARALKGVARRWESLGLDEYTCNRAAEILANSLSKTPTSRSDIIRLLTNSGIDVTGQRAYHMLWYSSQIGVACIGPNIGKEQSFVLLEEFAPPGDEREYEAAIAELANRYFRSHGPALQSDFAGWAGITITDAKRGIAALGDDYSTVIVDGTAMIVNAELLETGPVAPDPDAMHLLAGFDEFILGFKNRDLVLPASFKNHIVPGGNGIFRPTVVDGGRVTGTWSRTIKPTSVAVKVEPFVKHTKKQQTKINRAARDFGHYLGKEVSIT